MQRPWTATNAVEPALARALIATAAPGLAGATLEPFGEGWDNTAYLVGGEFVFRFPRRPLAAALMETEIRALPWIAGRLPLPVPRPVHAGAPACGYPWPFAGYARLAGDVAAELDLDAAARADLALPLGRFLSALHALPARELAERGVPGDELGRLDDAARLPRARERLRALMDAGALEQPERLAELLERGLPRDFRPRADVPVHGDLDARHVLVSRDGAGALAAAGVIDFGDLHLGDPATDLALFFAFLPPAPSPARPAFRAAYGPIDPGTLGAARFKAVEKGLGVLEWALATGRAALAREARLGLAFAAA